MQEACLGLQGLQKKTDLFSVQGWALSCTLTLFPWVFLERSAQTEGHLPLAPAAPGEGSDPVSQGA